MTIDAAFTEHTCEDFPLWCALLGRLRPDKSDSLDKEIWNAARWYNYENLPPLCNVAQAVVADQLAAAIREKWPLFRISDNINGEASCFWIEDRPVADFVSENLYTPSGGVSYHIDTDKLNELYQTLYPDEDKAV